MCREHRREFHRAVHRPARRDRGGRRLSARRCAAGSTSSRSRPRGTESLSATTWLIIDCDLPDGRLRADRMAWSRATASIHAPPARRAGCPSWPSTADGRRGTIPPSSRSPPMRSSTASRRCSSAPARTLPEEVGRLGGGQTRGHRDGSAPGRWSASSPPKGGVGKTTISVNLAVALREQTHASVLLFDADVGVGNVTCHPRCAGQRLASRTSPTARPRNGPMPRSSTSPRRACPDRGCAF